MLTRRQFLQGSSALTAAALPGIVPAALLGFRTAPRPSPHRVILFLPDACHASLVDLALRAAVIIPKQRRNAIHQRLRNQPFLPCPIAHGIALRC